MRGSRHLEGHPFGAVLIRRFDLRPQRLGVDAHRAELGKRELAAVAPDTPLPEQHGTAVVQLDRDRDRREQRRQQDERRHDEGDVEASLRRVQAAGLPPPRPADVAGAQAIDERRVEVGSVGHGGALVWRGRH
jgi:hypothetical protein